MAERIGQMQRLVTKLEGEQSMAPGPAPGGTRQDLWQSFLWNVDDRAATAS
jgi:hypothetical protein